MQEETDLFNEQYDKVGKIFQSYFACSVSNFVDQTKLLDAEFKYHVTFFNLSKTNFAKG